MFELGKKYDYCKLSHTYKNRKRIFDTDLQPRNRNKWWGQPVTIRTHYYYYRNKVWLTLTSCGQSFFQLATDDFLFCAPVTSGEDCGLHPIRLTKKGANSNITKSYNYSLLISTVTITEPRSCGVSKSNLRVWGDVHRLDLFSSVQNLVVLRKILWKIDCQNHSTTKANDKRLLGFR